MQAIFSNSQQVSNLRPKRHTAVVQAQKLLRQAFRAVRAELSRYCNMLLSKS